jgi:hypothetical protein
MGDSIRLRLTQDEVSSLARGGPIESLTQFPGEALMFALEPSELDFESHHAVGRVTVRAPLHLIQSWAKSGDEGLYQNQPVAGGSLRIAIEKDYACLHKADSPENAGTFANPGAKAE